jgi:large subunit ribosomal protein L2
MGKRIISQRRGRGTSRYSAPSHRYKTDLFMPKLSEETEGKISDIVHCPGHSSPVLKLKVEGKDAYIPAPEGVRVNDTVLINSTEVGKGNIMALGDIPEGTEVFNIEAKPGDGGKFVRSGGATAKVVAKVKGRVTVLLPSKKTKEFHPSCRAIVGVIAGAGRLEKPLLKAGNAHFRMKARNKLYPKTSGNSMNAVDHPYGTSRTSKKGRPTTAKRNAPPGAKVGKIKARRTGRKRGKQ